MYDDILVPSDGSPEADAAASHAIQLASHVDATLHALFVVDPDPPGLDLAGGTEIDADRSERGERVLSDIRERAAERGIDVETTVAEGDPADVIVQQADGTADLVVMGTHGRSGVERVLIGSVAERVVRASPVPVTTLGSRGGGESVTSAERARQIAREQLAIAGHEDATVEAPSRQRTTWVVHASADGHEYNVHINSASGRAKLVQVG
jgi:nucleotide-binding universal stress UspA family protein